MTSTCPHCRTSLTEFHDGAGRPVAPEVGDVSACETCGGYLRIEDDGSRVKLTREEFDGLPEAAQKALFGVWLRTTFGRSGPD